MSNSQQMPTVISEKEHLNALIWKQPYCKPNTCLEVCPLNMTWIKKWITRVTYSMKISHGTVSLHLWRLGWWPQPTSWSSSIDSQGLVGFKATNWIFTSKTRKKPGSVRTGNSCRSHQHILRMRFSRSNIKQPKTGYMMLHDLNPNMDFPNSQSVLVRKKS